MSYRYSHIDLNTPVTVNNMLYKQVVTTDINSGNLVLDIDRGLFGVCVGKKGDNLFIDVGWNVVSPVPINRLRKLVFSCHLNVSLN